MNINYDKLREKIPRTPALIPNIYMAEVNIEEELSKMFGAEKVFTEEQIQKIKSYSLSFRDFITNIKTILLFVTVYNLSMEDALNRQYSEQKITMAGVIPNFLLEKEASHLNEEEKKQAVGSAFAVFDKNNGFHVHPIVAEIKKEKS